MRNIVFLFMALVFVVACSKSGKTYYCQCTITTAVGSGTYIGSNSVRARAEADCSNKMAEVQADGHTANCDVVEIGDR